MHLRFGDVVNGYGRIEAVANAGYDIGITAEGLYEAVEISSRELELAMVYHHGNHF